LVNNYVRGWLPDLWVASSHLPKHHVFRGLDTIYTIAVHVPDAAELATNTLEWMRRRIRFVATFVLGYFSNVLAAPSAFIIVILGSAIGG
jgi:hypothetical protein